MAVKGSQEDFFLDKSDCVCLEINGTDVSQCGRARTIAIERRFCTSVMKRQDCAASIRAEQDESVRGVRSFDAGKTHNSCRVEVKFQRM